MVGAFSLYKSEESIYKMEGSHKVTTGISMLLSILIVLFLSIAREAYAITVIFMLLVIKGILLLKYSKVSS